MQQMPPYRCCPLLPAPPKGEDASLRLLSQRSRLNYCVDEITTVRSATIAGYFPRRQAKRVLSEAVQRGNRWAARAGGGRPAPHETLSRASRHQRNQTARVVFVNRHASLVRIAGGPEGPRRVREATGDELAMDRTYGVRTSTSTNGNFDQNLENAECRCG